MSYFSFLGLEKTQKSLNKNKKKKKKKSGEVDDDDDDDNNAEMSKQKVLDWPVENLNNIKTQSDQPKKYRKGFQKKQNAQL